MIHTNHGELIRIFDTYCRVWGAGGQATLTTSTKGGLLTANLDIQLGPPTAACPGAPPPHLQRQTAWTSSSSSPTPTPGHPGAGSRRHRRRRRHRGPAAKARSNARAASHQASLVAAKVGTAPAPPPPPPLHLHQRCQHGRSSLWGGRPASGLPFANLMVREAAR